MQPTVRVVLSLTFVIVAALLCAGAASAAEPRRIGKASSAETGGCHCVIAQYGTAPIPVTPYEIPSSGVLTESTFYVGETSPGTEEWVRAGLYRRSGSELTEVGRGGQHSVVGLPIGLQTFLERVPVQAGDLLGARFNVSGFIKATPRYRETSSTADEIGYLFNFEPTLGTPFHPETATKRQADVGAVVEADADGDGYGDSSQDLCPGSPIATAACSGVLFGSNLQGERSPPPPACGGGGCMRIQTRVGGVSTAAPFDGVVVRWRVLSANLGSLRVRVVSPQKTEAGFDYYKVLRSSALESVTSSPGFFTTISSFSTRLPIPAGSYVGLAGGTLAFQASSGAATYDQTNEVPDNTIATGQSKNGTILYDADIEPDVDGDGYGDVTQDSCPSAATVHEGACPVSPPAGAGGGSATTGAGATTKASGNGGHAAASPTISGLALKPRSFRAKPLAAATASGAWGAKVKLKLSSKATVSLKIEARQGGHFTTLGTLTKALGAGKRSIPYSGQYRHAGKIADLPPGPYRLTARAKNATGTGPPKRTSFTILPPS